MRVLRRPLWQVALFVGLALPFAAQADTWAPMATISGTTNLVTNSLCYTDGQDIICNGNAPSATASPTNVPAFNVNKGGTDQTGITASTWSKLTFSTKVFDTMSNFNTSTSRFTPTVAGNYLINASIYCSTVTSCYVGIYKNGTIISQSGGSASSQTLNPDTSIVVPLNGSTDYVEAWVYISGGTSVLGQANATNFSGSLVASGNGLVSGTSGASTFAALTDVSTSTTGGNIFGPGSLTGASTGVTNSTAFGIGALSAASNSGYENTAFGRSALAVNTSGYSNTATGLNALATNTTGAFNTATGVSALSSNNAGNYNSAFGGYALQFNSTGILNAAFGLFALQYNSTGGYNTAVGPYALLNNTASYNTALGYSAGTAVTSGANNSFVGAYSGQAVTTGASNTLIGYNAAGGLTTGSNNVVLGAGTSPYSNTGSNQLNIGSAIWGNIGSGLSNANLIGINVTSPTAALDISGTLKVNGVTITGGGGGASAFASLTDVSVSLAGANIFGPGSTAGAIAGYNANTAYGVNALSSTLLTSNGNSAVGYAALGKQRGGDYNTAMGANAQFSNTSGLNNAAFGAHALYTNTTGSYNAAVGRNSLYNNTADQNTALGYGALRYKGGGTNNVGVGYNTGLGVDGSSSFVNNTLLGAFSGAALTTGGSNTLIGYNAGAGITTGIQNIVIGAQTTPFSNTGSNQLNIGNAIWGSIGSGSAGNNSIGINVTSPTAALEVSGTVSSTRLSLASVAGSAGVSITVSGGSSTSDRIISSTSGVFVSSTGVVGIYASGSSAGYFNTNGLTTNLITVGNSFMGSSLLSVGYSFGSDLSGSTLAVNGAAAIGAAKPNGYQLYVAGNAYTTGSWSTSDVRYKENIQPMTGLLAKVEKLRPVTFTWKKTAFPAKDNPGEQIGLIAQEVEKIYPELVHTDGNGYKAVAYDRLGVLLLGAVKDLKAENDALKKQNADFEARLRKLEAAASK